MGFLVLGGSDGFAYPSSLWLGALNVIYPLKDKVFGRISDAVKIAGDNRAVSKPF